MSDLIEAMARAMQAESADKPFRWENAAIAGIKVMRVHFTTAMVEACRDAMARTTPPDPEHVIWRVLNAAITEAEERDDG